MVNISTMVWGILFGSMGLGFFIYGKKQNAFTPLFCGIGLMVIPYLINNIYFMIIAGLVLCILPFLPRFR